jgi:RNA polymerase sigma-70 factor (ECF subfamily)
MSIHPHRRTITDTDRHLLRRLCIGDADAFDQLYRRTADTLTRYVTAQLPGRDRDAVDDLMQDAFCTALANPRLLGEDLLGSMLRLAARAVTRHGWSQRRYVRAAYTVYQDRTAAGAADPRVAENQTVAVLARPGFVHALARLTALQRRAVQLRYLDGYPRDHAAHAMGRSTAAMRDLERRALRRLQHSCTA